MASSRLTITQAVIRSTIQPTKLGSIVNLNFPNKIPKIKDHKVEVFSIFHFKKNYGILELKNVLPIQMSILPFIVVFVVYLYISPP